MSLMVCKDVRLSCSMCTRPLRFISFQMIVASVLCPHSESSFHNRNQCGQHTALELLDLSCCGDVGFTHQL